MEKRFLLLIMCSACCAVPQDLSGKMFTFPVESKTTHVKLLPSGENFTSVSVCLRFFTDLDRAQSLFSMATPTRFNGFLLFKGKNRGQMNVHSGNQLTSFQGLPGLDELNRWVSVCGTWESETGLAQVWINGKPSSRKLGLTRILDGEPIIILGQEQDSHGGGFDSKQSFVGQLSDVHMWDYALSPCEIQRFMENLNFTPGDVLNWRALEFTVKGNVVVETKPPAYCTTTH